MGKCFTADEGASATGLVAPADPCSDLFGEPYEGGYRVLTLDFSDFGPGETFAFSVDRDPTSINGTNDPGPNGAGMVSGLELTGAEATVEFDDDSTHSGETYRVPDSLHSSRNTLEAGAPPKPSIEGLGISAPGKVSDSALVMVDLAQETDPSLLLERPRDLLFGMLPAVRLEHELQGIHR